MTGTVLLRVFDGNDSKCSMCNYHILVDGIVKKHTLNPTLTLQYLLKGSPYYGPQPSQIDIQPNVSCWPDPINFLKQRLRVEELGL